MKNVFKKKTYKFLFFISLFLITITSVLVNISASGIEYGEEDTIFTFDLNRDYLNFIDESLPNNFSYYFTLPITFQIGNSNIDCYNLSVRIENGTVSSIWYEGRSNLGSPVDYYFVENGEWTDGFIDTDIVFAQGIKIKETYINDLYNFNFQYDDIRTWENIFPRFYKYIAINNLLTIRLNTFRFKTDLENVVKQNDTILNNVSMIYVEQGVDSGGERHDKIIGLTIGGNLLDNNGNEVQIPIPKISFMSNNEKYNELEGGISFDGSTVTAGSFSYNNFTAYDIDNSTPWVNNNYKFLTLFNNIGIMDYLNLSIYGDFNVSQFWVDPDTDATFNDLFTGIANIPIIVLSNLLSFSVFGWTAFTIFTGIITLLVIVWLIRKLTR